MSTAAPPAWVKAAPGLSAAHKFMLQVLWGYGPYKRTGPDDGDGDRQPSQPVRLWASRETLATATDQSPGTVKNQLRKLAAEGWIRRDSGSNMTLAWRAVGVFEYGARATSAPPRATEGPGHTRHPPGHECTPAGQICTPGRATGAPQSSKNVPIELPTNVVEAREPLPPPPKPMPAQTSLVTGKPSAAQRSALAQLERERAEVRERFSTGERPAGSKLPEAVFKAIEAHDNGAWSAMISSQNWADSCHAAMDADNLDVARVLALLDAWTAEAVPCRQDGQPRKQEIWYTWGDRGKVARKWLDAKLAATRAPLRVVGGVSDYELELEEMRR